MVVVGGAVIVETVEIAVSAVAVEEEEAAAVATTTGTARPARRTSRFPSLSPSPSHISPPSPSSDTEKRVNQGWGANEGEPEFQAETAAAQDATTEAAAADDAGWGAPAVDSWDAPAADAWDAPAPSWDVPATPADASGEKDTPKGEGRERRERRAQAEEEEEDNTLTLEQYLKQKQGTQLDIVPKLETRRANEGEEDVWKGAVAVPKKDEDAAAYFVGKVRLVSRFFSLREDPSIDVLFVDRPRRRPSSRAPRKKRKSSSRSTRGSRGPRAGAGAEAQAETDPSALSAGGAGVGAAGDADGPAGTATAMAMAMVTLGPLTSTTRARSRPSLSGALSQKMFGSEPTNE